MNEKKAASEKKLSHKRILLLTAMFLFLVGLTAAGVYLKRVADRIIAEQKIEVDAVSGATNSSTVIKKAVENAIRGKSKK